MSQLPASNAAACDGNGDAGASEDAAGPCKPASQVGGEVGVSSRGQLTRPEVLTACAGASKKVVVGG